VLTVTLPGAYPVAAASCSVPPPGCSSLTVFVPSSAHTKVVPSADAMSAMCPTPAGVNVTSGPASALPKGSAAASQAGGNPASLASVAASADVPSLAASEGAVPSFVASTEGVASPVAS